MLQHSKQKVGTLKEEIFRKKIKTQVKTDNEKEKTHYLSFSFAL